MTAHTIISRFSQTTRNYRTVMLCCMYCPIIAGILFILWKVGFIQQLFTGSIPMLDFDTYYQLGRDVLAGNHPYQVSYMQTMGPPLVIVPFIPFSFLPLQLARSIITTISLASCLFTSFLLASHLWHKRRILITQCLFLLLLLPFATRFTLQQGQVNLIVMWLLTIVLLDTDEKRKGLALGLVWVLKTFFIMIAVASWKRVKTMQWTIGLLGVVLMLSLPVIKPQYYYDFITQRLGEVVLAEQAVNHVDYYNQSLKATTRRFGIGQYYPYLLIFLLIISVVYLLRTQNIAASIVLSLILSPVVWQHYVVIVYPLLILFAKMKYKHHKIDFMWVVISGILLSIEAPWIHLQPLTLTNSIIASHFFIGLIMLLAMTIKTQLVLTPTSSIKGK